MAEPTLKALRDDRFDYWKARHLLTRAGFGGTPAQIRGLANMGLDDAVDYVVDYRDIDFDPVSADNFDHDIMRPRTEAERRRYREARRNGDEAVVEEFRQERQRRQKADRKQMRELQRWWLGRMIRSPRPLEEKMTLFWHGHFATGYRTIEDSYHLFLQNQLFRSHAVGNFKRLTHGIIRDPAMLRYLNNNQNRRQKPNENLARELMELFTLGEGNGYTERDIKEGARALTGYTYRDDEFIDLASRQYQRIHDDGEKRILGQIGEWDGDEFVDIIFSLNYVSEFICWKLYRYFVNDLPGDPDSDAQKFIRLLAKKFRQHDYDLAPVLKILFRSEHFYDDANVASLIKSPIQLIVQAIRSLNTPTRDMNTLLSAAGLMGQSLFQPPSVKGWDGGRSWINTSTLFVRQNTLVYLLTGRRTGQRRSDRRAAAFDAMHLLDDLKQAGGSTRPADVASYLLRFCLGGEANPKRIGTLEQFIRDCGGQINNNVLIGMLSLITAMPEYQLC